MSDLVFDFLKQQTSAVFIVSLFLAFAVARWFGGLWTKALEGPGRDRVRLIRSLRPGGRVRVYYVYLISRFLNRVDRFLNDAGKSRSSLPSPFGNRTRAPYWTGWSFDVCALLAVVYPIASLWITWLYNGDSGDIGETIGFAQGASLQVRLGSLAAVLGMIH